MEVLRVRGAALAAAASLVAVAISGCGAGDEAAETALPTAAEPAPPTEVPPPRPAVLRLPSDGHPVVWVRQDRHVNLFDEPGGSAIQTVADRTEFGSRTVYGVVRTHGHWAGVSTPYLPNGQLAWVRLDPDRLRSGAVAWEIRIDLSDYEAKLVLRDRVVRSFSVSVGMPGAETPTGRFAVTDTFRGDLNAAYGCCALALTARQVRLPSGWLGGDRIAIHGTSGPLGAAISHGCVRAGDVDVSELVDRLPLGTPVVIQA